jgi:hypothetical protein
MALGIKPVLANTAQIKITKIGVPTDLPHENRVSQLAKNTDKQSEAATNRSEEGLDIPKSRKNFISYTDLMSWIVRCTRYKVQNWKYIGNMIEIDSASLREINRKYDGNRVEIDSASLREINRKYY